MKLIAFLYLKKEKQARLVYYVKHMLGNTMPAQ